MSDEWREGRWLGQDGRWRTGAPPSGWWESPDGHWHPPDLPGAGRTGPTAPGGAYLDGPTFAAHPSNDSDRGPSDVADPGGPSTHDGYRDVPVDPSANGYSYTYRDADAGYDDPVESGFDDGYDVGATQYDAPAAYGLDGAAGASTDERRPTRQVPSVTAGPYDPDMPHAGPRPVGAVESFRGLPGWAQIAIAASAVLVLLTIVGVALGDPEPERAATSDAPTTTTATSQSTVATAPAATTAPPATAPPPPPSTTAPATTAPPPPPPPTTAPPPTAPPATAAPATAAPAPASNCHPSYTGCVPADASDVDCAGGSGDGPAYTGPVQVIGPDVYDLDRDGNGYACETS